MCLSEPILLQITRKETFLILLIDYPEWDIDLRQRCVVDADR